MEVNTTYAGILKAHQVHQVHISLFSVRQDELSCQILCSEGGCCPTGFLCAEHSICNGATSTANSISTLDSILILYSSSTLGSSSTLSSSLGCGVAGYYLCPLAQGTLSKQLFTNGHLLNNQQAPGIAVQSGSSVITMQPVLPRPLPLRTSQMPGGLPSRQFSLCNR
jgi:hypothetical protein